MFASEHPEVIEGRRRLIATYFLYSDEGVGDISIDNGGDALDKEYDRVLGELDVRTYVTQSGT